jgi:Phage terminase, small subunit
MSPQMRALRGNPGKRRPIVAMPGFAASPTEAAAFASVPVELETDAVAATEWRRLAPHASPVHRSHLIALCRSWSRYQALAAIVQADGLIVPGAGGVMRVHPAVKPCNEALTQYRQQWAVIGFDAGVVSGPVAARGGGKWADL